MSQSLYSENDELYAIEGDKISPEMQELLNDGLQEWLNEAEHRSIMGVYLKDPMMFGPCTCPYHSHFYVPEDFEVRRPTDEAAVLQTVTAEFDSLADYQIID